MTKFANISNKSYKTRQDTIKYVAIDDYNSGKLSIRQAAKKANMNFMTFHRSQLFLFFYDFNFI